MDMDNGFTFSGRHVSELGAAFIPSKWPGSAPVTINDATVPGRDGTIRYPGQTYGVKIFEGTLYILDPDDELMSYARMMERVSEISAWLQPGGQQRLTLDAAPEQFYMAEITHALEVTTGNWENGAITLKFTLQPFAYANHDNTISFSLAADTEQSKTLGLPGNRPAPVKATVTAAAAMTWLQIATGEKLIRLEGMALQSGDVIRIDADVEKSEVPTVTLNGEPARGYVTAESAYPLYAQPGNNTVAASADGACAVTVSARGRWK
jgi:phage-related protein